MQDLVEELKQKAGLTEEQAIKSLQTIKEYIQSRIPPMFSGFVDNFLGDAFKTGADDKHEDDFIDHATNAAKSAAEKTTEFAKKVNEHAAEFAKDAAKKVDEMATKAEAAAKDALDKMKDIMKEHKDGNK